MNTHEINCLKLDIIKHKLRNISIVVHQSIKSILSKKSAEIKASCDSEEDIRTLIRNIREDINSSTMFQYIIEKKLPEINNLCTYAVNLIKTMCDGSNDFSWNHSEFWISLFEHFLKISFIYPTMYICENNLFSHIKLIDDAWDSFLLQNVPLQTNKIWRKVCGDNTCESITISNHFKKHNLEFDKIINQSESTSPNDVKTNKTTHDMIEEDISESTLVIKIPQ